MAVFNPGANGLYRLIRSFIPYLDRPCAILALGYAPLKVFVGKGMVLDHHRQVSITRAARRPFRHRPALKHAAVLEPKVVVQLTRAMFLHDKNREGLPRAKLCFGAGLAGLFKIPLLLVYLEPHSHSIQLHVRFIALMNT